MHNNFLEYTRENNITKQGQIGKIVPTWEFYSVVFPVRVLLNYSFTENL
jgi:hypothetical protein